MAAPTSSAAAPAPKSMLSTLTKRVRTGFFMAGVATVWIFSGNWVFSVGFALQAMLAQLEYYRMAMQKGEQAAIRAGGRFCRMEMGWGAGGRKGEREGGRSGVGCARCFCR